jgi:hypothetical protein
MIAIIGIILIILLFIINWQIERGIKFTDNARECRNTLYPVFSKATILKQQARIDLSQDLKKEQSDKIARMLVEEWNTKSKKKKKFSASESLQYEVEIMCEYIVSKDIELKELNAMIEANIAALNGSGIEDEFMSWHNNFHNFDLIDKKREKIEKLFTVWKEELNDAQTYDDAKTIIERFY